MEAVSIANGLFIIKNLIQVFIFDFSLFTFQFALCSFIFVLFVFFITFV